MFDIYLKFMNKTQGKTSKYVSFQVIVHKYVHTEKQIVLMDWDCILNSASVNICGDQGECCMFPRNPHLAPNAPFHSITALGFQQVYTIYSRCLALPFPEFSMTKLGVEYMESVFFIPKFSLCPGGGPAD